MIVGTRIQRTRLVQTEKFVVAVEISMVIPADDPSEPCIEPKTVQMLKEVRQRADAGDIEWLRRHGKVYAAVDAA